MRIRCRIEFPYASARTAGAVARALKVDDAAYIRTAVKGRTLVADAAADSPMALLHTLEDYLACLSVAERVLRR